MLETWLFLFLLSAHVETIIIGNGTLGLSIFGETTDRKWKGLYRIWNGMEKRTNWWVFQCCTRYECFLIMKLT